MAYKVIILYQLYMPSYFLGTFTEYPYFRVCERHGATNGRSGQGEPEIEKIRFAFQKL